MNAPLIRLRGIEKDYGEAAARVSVLRGINLDVAPGDFLAIMGASGSGKSTLLNLIGCLDRPSRGVYEFEGEDVAGFSDDRLSTIRNERIGFIFQSFNLVAGLTVLENVEVPLYYGSVPPRTRAARCRELLAAVGLGHRLGHRPNQLSGGECQRVAIARALVNDPALLLADEPTGNLDSRTGQEVLELIGRLHGEGHTVVMITHDAAIAARARRHIRMWDGMLEEAA